MTSSQSDQAASESVQRLLQAGRVLSNALLCRDHFRLVLTVAKFAKALPGQFLHISPESVEGSQYRTFDWNGARPDLAAWTDNLTAPMLRRAYSIAELRPTLAGIDIEIIYRVVGKSTQWLASLTPGDAISVLGPLGNSFPISAAKEHAWLIAGGVGLPPLLWLAKFLRAANKKTVMFYGAQSGEHLAVRLNPLIPPDTTAHDARLCVQELATLSASAIVSTDDGSVGFRGHVGNALDKYAQAHASVIHDVVIYTCGPERMMRFVADFTAVRGIEAYVCMERAMACGTGTCQSCVVPIRQEDTGDWRYSLCCTEGPVYAADTVLWDAPVLPLPSVR